MQLIAIMCSIVFFLFVVFCEYAAWNGLVGKLRLVQSGRHAHWSKYEGRCAFARVVTDVVVVVVVAVAVVVVAALSSSCSPGTHLHWQIDRQAPIEQTKRHCKSSLPASGGPN